LKTTGDWFMDILEKHSFMDHWLAIYTS
jgi:hypothetical protein